MSTSRLPAISLIEVIVAAGLISMILTALSSNLLLSQKTIINTQLRARALEQAESCINRIAAGNDYLSWYQFTYKIKNNGIGVICNNANEFKYQDKGTYYSGDYEGKVYAWYESGGREYKADIRTLDASQITMIRYDVTVKYQDFDSKQRSVTVSRQFRNHASLQQP